MPVITLSASDLKSLIGNNVQDEKLREALPLIKCEIEAWEGDELKVEVTPDRPDLLSTEGIARQASHWLGFTRGLQTSKVAPPKIFMRSGRVRPRPEIVAGVVRGLTMTDSMVRSLMQLQEAIDMTIGRGRVKTAIGVHDVSRVKPPFSYKEVGPFDVKFVPLGSSKEMTIEQVLFEHPKGEQYGHIFGDSKTFPVILDSNNQVISFPPIINGELTKVTPQTKDIFIDITGHEKAPLNHALNILMAALEMRGGRPESVKINNRTYPEFKPWGIKFDKSSVKSMLGLDLKEAEIKDCLERMGYGVNLKTSHAIVPPYRVDIMHPVDVIEDIAIAYGFNKFIPEVPRLPTIGKPDPEQEFSLKLRELMTGMGMQEMINLSLSNKEKQFTRMRMKSPGAVEIANPASKEHTICRHWVLPSLLENLSSNIHRRYPQRIFELSECILPDPKAETRTRNVFRLGVAVSHADAGFSEIMSLFNAFNEALPLKLGTSEHRHPSFIEGRCVAIFIENVQAGVLGELHPDVLRNFGLKMPVAAFEVITERIWNAIQEKNKSIPAEEESGPQPAE